MSWPSSRTRPVTRGPGTSSCMRLSARRRVGFPHPDVPIRAVTVFGAKGSVTSRTPELSPYHAVRASAARRGGAAATWGRRAAGGATITAGGCATASGTHATGAGHQPRRDAQDEHHHDQDQRPSPGLPVPLVVRADGVHVNLERQRRHWLEQPGREELVA